MKFTQAHKNEYLDSVALKTQQGIWMTEMALMKDQEQLAKKKALLGEIEQKIANKEYPSKRDGTNEKTQCEADIARIEREVEQDLASIITAKADLITIETFRKQPVEESA
jgi:hypothetical protein